MSGSPFAKLGVRGRKAAPVRLSRHVLSGSVLASLMALPLSAAPLALDAGLASQRGAAVNQRFLPSGASVVTTAETSACMVSRRIAIDRSVYREADGRDVPFSAVIRSPAASVQAVAAAGAAPGFRIQLKYSPAPGTPILLTLGSARAVDIAPLLEPSSDSLWIDGSLAQALADAFGAGVRPVIKAQSADTGRTVTDRLDVPDLAALEACQKELGAEAALAAGAPVPALAVPGTTAVPVAGTIAAPRAAPYVTNEIRARFHATPETAPLATLPELRACGMQDAPGLLHIARLEEVSGFVAHTDKVFVSFDDKGRLAQVYVPGIFDGDFRTADLQGGGRARLSRAADSNLPVTANATKGCLGAASVEVCSYPGPNGLQQIAPCLVPVAALGGPGGPGGSGPGGPGGPGGSGPSGPGFPGGGGGGGGGGGTPPTLVNLVGGGNGGAGGGGDETITIVSPEPPPVPLPLPALLLASALAGLALLRRAVWRA